jgi:molecular chaperone GrpE
MSDRYDNRPPEGATRPADPEARAREEAQGVEPEAEPPMSEETPAEREDAPQTELEILRGELAALQERLETAERRLEEEQSRALRARAELDTVRRRATGDQDRAREAGLDTAVLPVMAVYDDLRRALQAAEAGDPASIVPGVRAVMESLERNLERLDIERVGDPGQPFDPDLHEALTSTPVAEGAEPGTIAEVFEAGFKRGDRLVRPARVVVYQDADEG